jgi:AraC family transcriptional activator of pobA
MQHHFYNPNLGSRLLFKIKESKVDNPFVFGNPDTTITIAWNRGEDQEVCIDGERHILKKNTVIPLMVNNNFSFTQPETIVSWQFNREFYCIVDHDKEVSCAGFIFYGSKEQMIIELDEKSQRKLEALLPVFEDEFEEDNEIQEEMLRMLVKRLIIIITRLGKQQFLSPSVDSKEEDIIRNFNLLLEKHFKEYHQVQDYANLLFKSPKTLSNTFSKYSERSPLQLIKDRIILEAKRLLMYTDLSSKEIAFELGFDDPASFSRFFKNAVKESPSAFKKRQAA